MSDNESDTQPCNFIYPNICKCTENYDFSICGGCNSDELDNHGHIEDCYFCCSCSTYTYFHCDSHATLLSVCKLDDPEIKQELFIKFSELLQKDFKCINHETTCSNCLDAINTIVNWKCYKCKTYLTVLVSEYWHYPVYEGKEKTKYLNLPRIDTDEE